MTETQTLTRTAVPPVSPEELPALEIKPGQDILALLNDELPVDRWVHSDDLCDCTFQRIGEWSNPYIGRTLRMRLCCLWAELAKQYPHLVQEIPAYWNPNDEKFEEEPCEWNGEDDMPKALWHRQLAIKHGLGLATIRGLYEGKEPPLGSTNKAARKAENARLWALIEKSKA